MLPDNKEIFPVQGTTREKDILQSAKLTQGANGQGDATEIYKIINDMESMNGLRFVTASSNVNIREHQIKLIVELSCTSYFECQWTPKVFERDFKLTEKFTGKLSIENYYTQRYTTFLIKFMICKFLAVY